VRLALSQMNATVGDIPGNAGRIRVGLRAAADAGAELVLFPELALTGYPPEDLLLKEHFLADAAAALGELASETHGLVAVVGFPERAEDVYNAAAVLADGAVHAIYRKVYLPNYGVFDEQRYFQAGAAGAVIDIGSASSSHRPGTGKAERLGLTVCEDIWEPGPPASEEALAGATLILNISASPYHAGKGSERERMFAQRARDNIACVAFCGLVGGQDELVFDGHSCVLDHTGATIARAAQFREELLVCDVDLEAAAAARLRDPSQRPAARHSERRAQVLPALRKARVADRGSQEGRWASEARTQGAWRAGRSGDASAASVSRLRHASFARLSGPPGPLTEPLAPVEAEVYAALTLGLRDYVFKNGFQQVVLGLSGGIDSALVACLAADALGPARVNVAIMPSPYSSSATQDDARALAAALGVHTHELAIEPVMGAYADALRADFAGREPDITEENLQARIRGNLLMALSNKFGWLVLATGNKSEMSVGYTTLYGDLAGGFAVIKDVPKTLVYRLCTWRNSDDGAGAPDAIAPQAGVFDDDVRDAATAAAHRPIPLSIIERAPSAELRADQRDEDSLPPYPVLDRILEGYVELDRSREQLIAQGLPEADVERTIRLVDLAEYKRRQAPPGIKITPRAFGRDRRMPITNRYRG
jgi:NAD+ synthase (glutamine-hydrolysing)